MDNAIIIGASSGIGRELAVVLSRNGYSVGLTGRRLNLLQEIQEALPGRAFIKRMDVSDPPEAMRLFQELIDEMGGVDLVVISAGTGFENPELHWAEEKETIDVNVSGFTAMANVAFRYFESAGHGHLVGISSLAALRGSWVAPAYNASKAFVSNYMEGLRVRARRANTSICVTEIQPGFVDTKMAKGEGLFWVAPPQKAAAQIFQAIQRKAALAYITKRWRIVAWILRILPTSLYARM